MNNSNGFQTGGIVLLAMSIVFCGLAFSMVLPMINAANQPGTLQLSSNAAAATEVTVSPKVTEVYAEFFSTEDGSTVQPTAEPITDLTSQAETTSYSSFPAAVAPQQQPTPQPLAAVPNHVAPQQPAVDENPFYASSNSSVTAVSVLTEPTRSHVASQPALPTPQQFPTSASTATTQETTTATVAQQPTTSTVASVSPSQMPAGSVYAPVTVNLDSSMFTEQTRQLEERLRDYQAHSEAQTQALARQAEDARKKQRRGRDRSEREDRDEELQKISQSFERLVQSFHELQNQTRKSLQQVSSQAETSKMAAELIASYKRTLSLEEERRKEILDASRIAVALEIQKFANQQQQLLQMQAQQNATNQVVRAAEVPAPVELPMPLNLPPEPTSSQVAPDVTVRMQASSISRPRVISPPRETRARQIEFPPIQEMKLERRSVVPKPVDRQSRTYSSQATSDDIDRPLEVTTPMWDLEPPEESKIQELEFAPLRVPTELESSSLTPVIDRKPRSSVAPVAYANTYRFKMDVDSGSKQQGIRSKTRKSVATGDFKTKQGQKRKVVQQTSAEKPAKSLPTQSKPVPAVTLPAMPSLPSGPTKDMKRDTRNAGRGMNRKFHTDQQQKKTETREPWLKLKVPSFTSQNDEPGLLHRMSSTVRSMGRSIRE